MSRLGATIRKARVQNFMTIGDLSEASGAHPSLISKIERGYVPARCAWLENIATALGIRPGILDYYHRQDLQANIYEYSIHDLRVGRARRLSQDSKKTKRHLKLVA